MKQTTQMFAVMMFGLVLLGATKIQAEMVSVVKDSDVLKRATYQVTTSAELRELQKKVQDEARVYSQAMAALKKEWDADEMNKGEPFPGSRLSPRKVEIKGTFTDRKMAQKKVESLEEREMDAADPEKDGKKVNPSPQEKEKLAREATRMAAAERLAGKLQDKIAELLTPGAKETPAKEAPAKAEPVKDAPKH